MDRAGHPWDGSRGGQRKIKGDERDEGEGRDERKRGEVRRSSGGVISEVDAMPSDRSSWETARPPALQTGQYGGQLLLPM